MDQLSKLRQATRAVLCAECGKCTSMCPLAASGDFSPRTIASQDLEDEINGRGVGVFRCLTCGSCELRCPQDVHFSEYVRGVRELIPPEAREPCPHRDVFSCAARLMATPDGPLRDTQWITGDLTVAKEGEVGLFVGCLPIFDVVFKEQLGLETVEIARAAVRVLNHLGVEPVVLDEERCCGHDQLWSGDGETFRALAEANVAAFAARGVKHIVTACAECCRTWRLDYAEVAPHYQPRVEHLAEFLAPRLESGEVALQSNGELKLTYQDPCRLGRHLGIYEAPRKTLAAMPGAKVVEMARNGRDALCCGTSGFIHCDADSRRLQTERLNDAAGTGAQKLITACPKCLIHFTCAQAEDKRRDGRIPSIEVQDLTVLAASMLEGSEKTEQATEKAVGAVT